MKNKKAKNELPDDISVSEILEAIDSKISEIESGKKNTTKTRIDGVDIKEILKVLDDECVKLENKEKKGEIYEK